MRQTIIVILLALICIPASAQKFKLDAEFRPRMEYSHGYSSLADTNQHASLFTTQRTRLNLGFRNDVIRTYISFQDVRLWGGQPQLVGNEHYSVSMHEAWAEGYLCEPASLKVGRQELKYDNHRIFGNVGWAQQGRSHDLALLKVSRAGYNVHLGFAYNENSTRTNNFYGGPDAYKAMQFLWLNHTFGDLELSLLLLNNGVPYLDTVDTDIVQKIRYSKTVGPYFKWGKDNLGVEGNFYFQTGYDAAGNDLSAYEVLLMGTFNVCDNFSIGAGYEIISGTAWDETDKNSSFTPFYGTNHKFNGFMDYFFVGNHANSVGLNDAFVKLTGKAGKATLILDVHNFSANAEIAADTDNGLGTEADLTIKYPIADGFSFAAGFSKMFATESLELIRGGNADEPQQWGYLMLTFTPTFLAPE